MNDEVPQTIGRYEVTAKIGAGAYGEVFKAYDPVLKRTVAIKMPARGLGEEKLDELLSDFYHAAEVGAQFQHANIVTVYDVGSKAHQPLPSDIEHLSHYLVMEYVPGVNLGEYLQQNPQLSLERALSIIFECCKALDYIHFNGISHRDIKPGNIIIDADTMTVKITDFSIADTAQCETKKNMGTLPYMTPDHFRTRARLTQQTDIFALGSVMYQLLTGVCPFRGDSVEEVVSQIISSHPKPIRTYNPDVPAQVEFIVIKAMSKAPKDRFQTALEFTDAVNLAIQTITSTETDVSQSPPTDIDDYLLLRNHKWFQSFSPSQVEELVRSGNVISFDAGEYIVPEVDEEFSFYIFLEGEADIVIDSQVMGHLAVGECFGEIGSSPGEEKPSSHIKATSSVRVHVVGSTTLSALSAESQASFYRAFLTVTLERLVKRNTKK